jgi:hypothetical protein
VINPGIHKTKSQERGCLSSNNIMHFCSSVIGSAGVKYHLHLFIIKNFCLVLQVDENYNLKKTIMSIFTTLSIRINTVI